MPRYYCDYCDTYLTHDSPSVRKQHNAGYKHKANVRTYYQQFEEQQTQSLIDQRIKEHLSGQAAYGQIGATYAAWRPGMPPPILPAPLPIPGMRPNTPMGMMPRLPVLPRPAGMPAMYGPAPVMPPGAGQPGAPGGPAPSMQANGLPGPPPLTALPTSLPGPPPMSAPTSVPGTTAPGSNGSLQTTTPMYQNVPASGPSYGSRGMPAPSSFPQASSGADNNL